MASLPTGTRIKPVGSEETIEPGHVVSKSNLTRESQELAQQRANLADAVEAYEFLNRDPEEFKRQLDEIVAAQAAAGARIGDVEPQNTDKAQGKKMDDDDLAEIRAELARTKDELSAVKNITLNGAATTELAGEAERISRDYAASNGRSLSPQQLTEVYRMAADHHLPSLSVAYEAWLGRTSRPEIAELREKVAIMEKREKYPQLGGSSERGDPDTKPKGRTLREIYDEHVAKLE